eukprot:4264166-Prymnesium_polylepis.2
MAERAGGGGGRPVRAARPAARGDRSGQREAPPRGAPATLRTVVGAELGSMPRAQQNVRQVPPGQESGQRGQVPRGASAARRSAYRAAPNDRPARPCRDVRAPCERSVTRDACGAPGCRQITEAYEILSDKERRVLCARPGPPHTRCAPAGI